MPTDDRRGARGDDERRGDDEGRGNGERRSNDEHAPRVPRFDEEMAGDLASEAGQDSVIGEPEADTADTADTAAASALARAREAARAKGLRPGSRPMRKRPPPGQQGGGTGRDGRDPSLLGDQMDRLLVDRGWNVDVAVGSVMGRWPAIVGADVAEHCSPVTFSDGVLTVRADSTAWATQLRLMASSIMGRLETEVGKDTVTELRVQGPSAPSWSRGLRKSTGPGPRDTYG